ncbi:PP0621 family protein [Candidatus Skiveiella danica]|uniref:PP0621 family protein n=1 Tax=Candidatus Skiveiella danica TaxID=3386177 RepID=UPI0039B84170
MKALIILLAILAGVWLWRSGRQKSLGGRANPPPEPPASGREAASMVACAVCGVHVPPSEAVAGRQGSYCSAAHRRQAEG